MRDSGSCILLYHGVTDVRSRGIQNFQGKHIWHEEFEKQMLHLSHHKHVVSFREYVRKVQDGILSDDDVSITFDDSYKNVARVALPILKFHDVPATFFISTGFIETDRSYWTDDLERMIINCLLSEMRFFYDGRMMSLPLKTCEEVKDVIIQMKLLLKRLMKKDRDAFFAHIKNELSSNFLSDDNEDMYSHLSWEDVRSLHDPPMYEVGGHTHDHEIFSRLSRDEKKHQVEKCLSMLRERAEIDADLFSYPEGQEDHFDEETIMLLKNFGIIACPTAIHGFNKSKDDIFHLKRVMVGFNGVKFPWDVQ